MTSLMTRAEASATLQATQRRLVERLSAHPFLAACRTGRVTRKSLETLLLQHGLYSSYFTRFLCALMANLPSGEQVIELAENLFDELGLAADSPTPHYVIYRETLASLGLSIQGCRPTPGTARLIEVMFAHCRSTDPAIGLGALCLGAEGLVPPLYTDFVKGFEALGMDSSTLHFFHLHIACDDAHTKTLLRLLVDHLNQVPDCLPRVVSAGEALVDARVAFLDDVACEAQGLVP